MSVRSMTGFGIGKAGSRRFHAEVQVQSVNGRQFDLRLNVPKDLASLESRIAAAVRARVSRGHVSAAVTVACTPAEREAGAVVRARMAQAYLGELRKVCRRMGLAADFSGRDLLMLPSVVEQAEPRLDPRAVWPVVGAALRGALDRLCGMRAAEGRALGRDLRRRVAAVRKRTRSLHALAPAAIARYRDALMSRLRRSGMKLDADDPALRKELILFAERSDFSEELTRLESHCAQAERLLAGGGAVGRTLDFLAQEMFREINTIGSKANDAAIARHVVFFKTEVDRIREQVQNVE